MNKKIRAFTLAEIMISLVVIALLIGYTTSRVLKQSPDVEKTRVKKAYIAIEQTVSSMVNNEVLYPGDLMLRNLEAVTTSVGDQFGVNNPLAKFRDSFLYYLNVVEEGIKCDVYVSNNTTTDLNECFKTADGVVYGIPDTDLTTVGVVRHRGTRVGAREYAYAPITVYPNFDAKKNVETDTMLIGVRYDAKVQILSPVGTCADDSEDINCRVLDMLHSDNIKREKH